MFTNLMLTQLEQFLNNAIQADENALSRLNNLVDKTLGVYIELPNAMLSYMVKFHTQYVKIITIEPNGTIAAPGTFDTSTTATNATDIISADSKSTTIPSVSNGYSTSENLPDVTITGTPLAFLCLLATKDPLLAKQQGLSFTDSAEIINYIQALFLHLDVDWEEHLSLFTGDIVAHEFCKLASWSAATITNTADNFAEMLSEFLLEEKRLSPTIAEVNAFGQDVAEVRSYLARLEARFNLLADGKI